MKRKAGIVLFIIAATAFNILVTAVCFGILLLLFSVLVMPHLSDTAGFIGSLFLLVASVVVAFFVYQCVLKRFKNLNIRQTWSG